MRQSELFSKTRKEAPKDEISKNASLLIRAGFIHKEMAGVYSYLPLGLRVLKKIEDIIREEMNALGGQEIFLTTLQDAEVWKKSGRWSDEAVDNWFKTKLKNGADIGIANTHEEPLTAILTQHVSSHKDLPLYIYQFQTKFRNELRAKSGILRCREFLMKDLYSFSRTEEEFRKFYEKCAKAYLKIFKRVGLGNLTYRTAAAGGSFTTGFTDEFQVLTPAGEDIIYIDRKKKLAVNKEIYSEQTLKELNLSEKDLEEEKSVEVGNIFPLGIKYSSALGLQFKDEKGIKHPVIMGSYGIGLGRLLGTIAEVLSDDQGLVWPESIAPFKVHLICLGEDSKIKKAADVFYKDLLKKDIKTLYDDRKLSAGEKLNDSDLIGIPWKIIIGKKTIETGKFELKNRATGKVKFLTPIQALKELQK